MRSGGTLSTDQISTCGNDAVAALRRKAYDVLDRIGKSAMAEKSNKLERHGLIESGRKLYLNYILDGEAYD